MEYHFNMNHAFYALTPTIPKHISGKDHKRLSILNAFFFRGLGHREE